MMLRNLALGAAIVSCAASASAQTSARELHLDFRPFARQLGLAWRVAQQWSAGIAVGGGIDELDRTLQPDTDSDEYHPLEQLANLNSFVRYKPSSRVDVDGGLRLGIGDVRNCFASDCWPGWLAGAYVGVSWGGKRWKVGPRLLFATVHETGDRKDDVVYVEILTGRFSVGW